MRSRPKRKRPQERATSLRFALGAGFLFFMAPVQAPAAAQADAATVKATFIYRFVSMVSWPANSKPASPVICVAGPETYRSTLRRVVAADRGGERSFVVRNMDDDSLVDGCHVLVVLEGEDQTRRWLRAAAGLPVLTVTDGAATPNIRGVIHFVVVDSRVRFHIDDSLAAAGRLSIDSRLLALALSVRRRDR